MCFSRIPHFSRPGSWFRSRCCRLWTALRMEDMVVYFCSQSAYQLYMKNRKVVMVVAGRGCKRKCRRRREKSSVLRRSLENCGRTTSRQLRWQEASIALLCFAVRFSGLVQSIDTVDSILFILSHPSHYSPSSRPLPPPRTCTRHNHQDDHTRLATTATTTTTTGTSTPQDQIQPPKPSPSLRVPRSRSPRSIPQTRSSPLRC